MRIYQMARLVVIAILIIYVILLMWFVHYYRNKSSDPISVAPKPVIERFQDEIVQDGSANANRITSLPSFEELSRRQKPIPCDSNLDKTLILANGNTIDAASTVGGYCEYIKSLDPIDKVLKKMIVAAEPAMQITSLNIIPSVSTPKEGAAPIITRTQTTQDLPVGYNSVFDNAGRRVVRNSTRTESMPGAEAFDDARRPLRFLPPTITNFEAWVGTSRNAPTPTTYNPATPSANGFRPISGIDSKKGPIGLWVNVSGFIMRNGLVYTDWIDWDASSNTIYKKLRDAGLPNMDSDPEGTNMRMAFIASHPQRLDLLIKGDPSVPTLPTDINTINMALNDSQGAYIIRNDTIAFTQANEGMNMFNLLYNVSPDRLSQKQDYTVPYYSWRFSDIKVQNVKTGLFLTNLRNSIQRMDITDSQAQNYLNRYEDVRIYSGGDIQKAKEHWREIGVKGDYEIEGSTVEANLNEIMMTYLNSGIGFMMLPQSTSRTALSFEKLQQYAQTIQPTLPATNLELLVRWKIKGSNNWQTKYISQTALTSPIVTWLSLAPKLGTSLIQTYKPVKVYDYTVQYTFTMKVRITGKTPGYRNIFNHGNKTETGVHSFPGLGIIGDDGTDRANNIVFNIMTEDDRLPFGQTVFVPALDAPGSLIPIGEWRTITVVINGINGVLYVSPNNSRRFTLDKKPIWPFINEKFRISDGDRTSPSDVGDEVRGCPKCGVTDNPSNLEIKDFRWYPVAIDEDYVAKNFLIVEQSRLTRQDIETESLAIMSFGNERSGVREWKQAGKYVFTVPDNIRFVRVLAVGGGGGGGGGYDVGDWPWGGDNGQVVQKIVNVTPGQIISVSVGAGGQGGGRHGNGSAGGNSSFSTDVIAQGGGGGARGGNPGNAAGMQGGYESGGKNVVSPDGKVIGKGGPHFNQDCRQRAITYADGTGNGGGGGGLDWCTHPSYGAGHGAPGLVRVEWGF